MFHVLYGLAIPGTIDNVIVHFFIARYPCVSTWAGKCRTYEKGSIVQWILMRFFLVEGIDEFTIVGIENLPDGDRSGPLHLLPSARSVIVFGREIPIPVYKLPSHGKKTQKMLHIAETLDRTAARLCGSPDCRKFPLICCPPVPARAGGIRADPGDRPAETNSCAGWTWHDR